MFTGAPRRIAGARPGALLPALLVSGLASAADKPGAAVTRTVVIDGMRFTPSTVDAKAGDTIVWKNNDPFAHTVTVPVGGPDSGEIPAGGSWSYRVKSAGTVAYICKLHPTMKAAIRVR